MNAFPKLLEAFCKASLSAYNGAARLVPSADLPAGLPPLPQKEGRCYRWAILAEAPHFYYRGQKTLVSSPWIDRRIAIFRRLLKETSLEPAVLLEHRRNGLTYGEVVDLVGTTIKGNPTLLGALGLQDPWPTDEGPIPTLQLIDSGRLKAISPGFWNLELHQTGEILEDVVREVSITALAHQGGRARILGADMADPFGPEFVNLSPADQMAAVVAAMGQMMASQADMIAKIDAIGTAAPPTTPPAAPAAPPTPPAAGAPAAQLAVHPAPPAAPPKPEEEPKTLAAKPAEVLRLEGELAAAQLTAAQAVANANKAAFDSRVQVGDTITVTDAVHAALYTARAQLGAERFAPILGAVGRPPAQPKQFASDSWKDMVGGGTPPPPAAVGGKTMSRAQVQAEATALGVDKGVHYDKLRDEGTIITR